MRDFNDRVGTHQNMNVDDSVMVSDSTLTQKIVLCQIMVASQTYT
mgnify:CR=1 FL=1